MLFTHKKMTKDQIKAEALSATQLYRRCGIGVTMGGGKTSIGLHHMQREYTNGARSFLVVAPKTAIFTSWEEELVKWNLTHLSRHITYTTYRSLEKQSVDHDCIYLDECHSLLYSHEFWLTNYGGKILGLTGTPPRFKGSEKGQMVSKFCPIVYSYLTDDAVDDGMLNDYRFIIHHLHLGTRKNVPMKKKDGGTWFQSEENAYAYWHNRITDIQLKIDDLQNEVNMLRSKAKGGLPNLTDLQISVRKESEIEALKKDLPQLRIMRMKALQNTPSKVNYAQFLLGHAKYKTLVFANTQEQADEMCPNSYHANNKESEVNLEMFKKGHINCLTCVAQLSEGINIPDLRELIILHAFSNERKAAQRIGRGLRLNPDDTSLTHILCFDGSKDEDWVNEALIDFDPEKIYHFYPKRDYLVDYYGNEMTHIQMPYGEYRPVALKPAFA
jgi:superfamily II DNA or RNA helicase